MSRGHQLAKMFFLVGSLGCILLSLECGLWLIHGVLRSKPRLLTDDVTLSPRSGHLGYAARNSLARAISSKSAGLMPPIVECRRSQWRLGEGSPFTVL